MIAIKNEIKNIGRDTKSLPIFLFFTLKSLINLLT